MHARGVAGANTVAQAQVLPHSQPTQSKRTCLLHSKIIILAMDSLY